MDLPKAEASAHRISICPSISTVLSAMYSMSPGEPHIAHSSFIAYAYRSVDRSNRLEILGELPGPWDRLDCRQHERSLRSEANSQGLCVSKPPSEYPASTNGDEVHVIERAEVEGRGKRVELIASVEPSACPPRSTTANNKTLLLFSHREASARGY